MGVPTPATGVMSTLIIYDGWQQLKLIEVVGVIVGPIVAMFVGHVVSASLAKQVDVGRSLTWDDRAAIVGSEAPFLFLCVPPLITVSAHLPLPPPATMPSGSRCGWRRERLNRPHDECRQLRRWPWRTDDFRSWTPLVRTLDPREERRLGGRG
jgi:hypothetical protein